MSFLNQFERTIFFSFPAESPFKLSQLPVYLGTIRPIIFKPFGQLGIR